MCCFPKKKKKKEKEHLIYKQKLKWNIILRIVNCARGTNNRNIQNEFHLLRFDNLSLLARLFPSLVRFRPWHESRVEFRVENIIKFCILILLFLFYFFLSFCSCENKFPFRKARNLWKFITLKIGGREKEIIEKINIIFETLIFNKQSYYKVSFYR